MIKQDELLYHLFMGGFMVIKQSCFVVCFIGGLLLAKHLTLHAPSRVSASSRRENWLGG